ncbi:Aste57867_13713 [Aphanomyces stellatus]|uniref:Aste57867_13713 protein n=1 Tax=Aphanomyces stellatus TaxID=120398 RepID=A0A485KZ70_9STRA|nr:hypothetical protein As57867_013663 [Aphanomyces stellatus]VFT90546.1 Aste57867_13713 [Aphanomyces stellatus]
MAAITSPHSSYIRGSASTSTDITSPTNSCGYVKRPSAVLSRRWSTTSTAATSSSRGSLVARPNGARGSSVRSTPAAIKPHAAATTSTPPVDDTVSPLDSSHRRSSRGSRRQCTPKPSATTPAVLLSISPPTSQRDSLLSLDAIDAGVRVLLLSNTRQPARANSFRALSTTTTECLEREYKGIVGGRVRRAPRPTSMDLPPFLAAVRAGDVDALESHLRASSIGAWHQVDPTYYQNALHWAIQSGHLAVVHRLLAHDAASAWLLRGDVVANTPLHLAVCKSRHVTKLLLDRGASVRATNRSGHSPLALHVLYAARDDATMTHLLFQAPRHRPDPNEVVRGNSLLHLALDRGLLHIACCLVKHGAHLDTKDVHGKMVFDKMTPKVCRLVLAHVNVHGPPPKWIADQERKHCMLCSQKFNRLLFFRRRHHCRHCGRLCCAACSQQTTHALAGDGGKHSSKTTTRVCTMCHDILTHKDAAPPTSDDIFKSTRVSAVYNLMMGNWDPDVAACESMRGYTPATAAAAMT